MNKPSKSTNQGKPRHRWLRRFVIGLFVVFLFIGAAIAALLFSAKGPADRVFRGKLESEWIAELKYNDDEQVEEWRQYGDEGIEVLLRGYEREMKGFDRLYRLTVRPLLVQFLPSGLAQKLPPPKIIQPAKRMRIASLVADLEPDPAIAFDGVFAMLHDETERVQHLAINYFNGNEHDESPSLELSPDQREKLLAYLIPVVATSRSSGVRNNAAVALRFFPDEKDRIVPALLTTMNNPAEYNQRAAAAETLFIIAPEEADSVEVIDILLEILHAEDEQVARRAPKFLAQTTVDSDRAVAELIKGLKRERGVSIASARALPSFPDYAEQSVPALLAAHDASDPRYRGYFRSAIEKLDPASSPPKPARP